MQNLDDGDLENQIKMATIYGKTEYADMMVSDSIIVIKTGISLIRISYNILKIV